MSYFQYQNNRYSIVPGKRPSNQSKPEVLQKIRKRLERLIKENKGLKLTELQTLFVKKLRKHNEIQLKDNGIDIAHNIAISAIMDAILKRMNHPFTDKDYAANQFAEDLLSTEDNEGKQNVREFFELLRDPTATPQEKIAEANKVVSHLNRASRNLIPGYSSTNRSIGKYRDPHLVTNTRGEWVETPMSAKLSKTSNIFMPVPYESKTRKTEKDGVEAQSSSISRKPSEAYYTPIRKLGR